MGNTSYIDNQIAYKDLLLAKQCIRTRSVCNKKCSQCKYYVDAFEMDDVFDFVIKILKAREPSLYFIDDIGELKKLIDARIKILESSGEQND